MKFWRQNPDADAYREIDLDTAVDVVTETFEHPVAKNRLRFKGVHLMSPEQFLTDREHLGQMPSGWLKEHPEENWAELLEDEYSRDFGHIIDMYFDKNMAPAIMIDDFEGDGRGRAIFHHGVGEKLPVAIFESKLPKLPLYLYHATYQPVLASIKEHGLGGSPDKLKAWEWSKDDLVCLTNDPAIAYSMAETADNPELPEEWLEEIIVIAVPTTMLDKKLMQLDPHIKQSQTKPYSFAYKGVIPWEQKEYPFQKLRVVKEYLRELVGPLSPQNILKGFIEKYPEDFKRGKKRDYCGISAASLVRYALSLGLDAVQVQGFFRVDNPTYGKHDFTHKQLKKMVKAGLNSGSEEDRRRYINEMASNAERREFHYVPHSWAFIEGKIIDPSGHYQFVKTGMASDIKTWRYRAKHITDLRPNPDSWLELAQSYYRMHPELEKPRQQLLAVVNDILDCENASDRLDDTWIIPERSYGGYALGTTRITNEGLLILRLAVDRNEDEVADTIAHEIAHIVLGRNHIKTMSHGEDFVASYARIKGKYFEEIRSRLKDQRAR